MYELTTGDKEGQTPEIMLSLDDLATAPEAVLRREGARRMIATALEVEVEQYIQSLRHLRLTRSPAEKRVFAGQVTQD